METVKEYCHNPHIRKCAAVAGSLMAVTLVAKKVWCWKKQAALRAERAAMKQDVVYLYTFPPWEHGASFSPWCLKVMAFMRLAQIPYEAIYTMDPSNSPTERLPYIVLNGEATCESSFIIDRLKKHFKVDPDSWLSPEQHATALATQRMLEDNMNWCEERYLMVDNMPAMASEFAREMKGTPRLFLKLFVSMARKNVIKILNTQGNGDLTDEQYHAEFLQDVIAFETILGDKPFLMGDKPTSYDCAALGLFNTIVQMCDISCPAVAHMRSDPRIVTYVSRLTAILFPDLEPLIKTRQEAKRHVFPPK